MIALAVTSAQRTPALNVPTVGETVKGYEATAWFGIGMPKGTPREIINKLNAEVNKALADPAIQKRLAELGGVPISVPDLRRKPFDGTTFWESLPLPETDPKTQRYSAQNGGS